MLGKQKCQILKDIRQSIADANGIPYETKECTHHGDCKGTCPRCESEMRYLEEQLSIRKSLGKKVTVAALCAGVIIGSAGCVSTDAGSNTDDGGEFGGAPVQETSQSSAETSAETSGEYIELAGEPAEIFDEIDGDLPYPYDDEESACGTDDADCGTDEAVEIMGDIAW